LFALSPLAALVVCVLGHVVVARAAPRLARHRGVSIAVLAGLAVLLATAVTFAADPSHGPALDRWGAAVSWLLAYLALAYFYVFGFYNVGESARRLRLLVELQAAAPRGLTLAELLTVYNARMIVEARLARMVAGGQLVERDGRYAVGRPLMLTIAKAFAALKILFLGGPSEFGGGRAASLLLVVILGGSW
jgi:hypothetical protein